ncbi:YidH family protein [Williamsia muralis]|uniref:YidH family protein n=1 Tax=Williamsia marianensis TaxID=85044 RepID=UPI0037F2D8C3
MQYGKKGGQQRRFPRWVYERGSEPDARFSLANERTYLAWIRTSLALMAAGVALQAFGVGRGSIPSTAASVLMIGASILLPLQAWWSWARTESSLRSEGSLPSPRFAAPLALVLSIAAVLVLWSVLL